MHITGKFGQDDILKQIYFGSESKYTGNMPLGPSYNDYKMICYTRIKDGTGSFTLVNLGEIQVENNYQSNTMLCYVMRKRVS